jgi:ribonuclease HII
MADFHYEDILHRQGVTLVAGIDEAGRGPLAGPVVAAAVILPRPFQLPGLTDSKKLSARRRQEFDRILRTLPGVIFHLGQASVEEIDRLNILRATHLAMRRAVEGLSRKPEHVLIDGLPVSPFPLPQTALVKGDSLSLSIAAASILAKVARDEVMLALDRKFPQYGFASHQGYGTAQHLASLRHHGPCPAHRRSFSPVAQTSFDFV